MFVHGGKSHVYHSDLHSLNLKTKKWSTVSQKGTLPSARYGHSILIVKGYLYVIGGYGADGFSCSDIHRLNLKTYEWTKMLVDKGVNTYSLGRHHHVAFSYNNNIYIYGGKGDGDSLYRDLLEIQVETGKSRKVLTGGNLPIARYGHVGALIGDCFYIHGGKDRNRNYFGELYQLDLKTFRWHVMIDNIPPSRQKERSFHSCTVHNNDIYLLWGDIDNHRIGDMIVYHLDNKESSSKSSGEGSTKTKKKLKEIVMKYQFEGEMRVMRVSTDIGYTDFINLLADQCGSSGLKIQYEDEDSDLISIRSALDLQEAFKYFTSSNMKKVKLLLTHDINTEKTMSPIDTNSTGSLGTVGKVDNSLFPTNKAFRSWKRGSLVGKGAFGEVYLGMDAETGELFAVKQVSLRAPTTSKQQIHSLQAEINMLKMLNHKNIVRYLGSEISDDYLNIFLEYQAGGSLSSIISKFQRLPENVIKKFTRQILLGLDYLHDNMIAHRDIKGANILVDTDGNVKLADFGASKQLADILSFNEGFNTVVGSPYWMAPEVIQGGTGNTYGRKADIWSVGAVVIEMATGVPPFYNLTPVNALFKIGSSSAIPDIPDYLSTLAQDFILKCLQRDVAKRPTAKELLNHPFISGVSMEEKKRLASSLSDMSVSSTSDVQTVHILDTPPSSFGKLSDHNVYSSDVISESDIHVEEEEVIDDILLFLREKDQ